MNWRPVRQLSGHWAVVPSSATAEPEPPKMVDQARASFSVNCASRPYWTMLSGSKSLLVASLPSASTVSCMASSRTVAQVQSLPSYWAPTSWGG